jgi:nitrite reductase/ring-hydroxylating ferredoxin subunit
MSEEIPMIFLCLESQVSADCPVRAYATGASYAVFKVGDSIYVTQDMCTHGPGSLSEGFVDGDEVECPFHQGRFNIRTGAPTAPPCTLSLKTWQPRIMNGGVWITPEPRD